MSHSNPPPERFAHAGAAVTTDDAQLGAFEDSAAAEVALPADAHVVGEPVIVTRIHYPGQPRIGLLRAPRDLPAASARYPGVFRLDQAGLLDP